MSALLTLKWHPGISDPTFAGWACTAAYLTASGLCGWAAMTRTHALNDNSNDSRRCWLLFAGILLLFGVNKQLDLQTLLIEFGRKLSRSEGWYAKRRTVQALFAVLFALAIVLGITAFVRKNRGFVREQPVAIAGTAILGLFLLIRASTLNHAIAAHIGDEKWGWLLELAGNFCIGLAAFKQVKRATKGLTKSAQSDDP